jgi:hypothetical protein
MLFPSRPAAGTGRDALPRDPRQHADGHVRCAASDGRCSPARPASHLWNRLCGRAAPDAPERAYAQRRCTGCQPSDVLPRITRERVPTIASAPPKQIVKPRASSPKRCPYDHATASIQDCLSPLTAILDSNESGSSFPAQNNPENRSRSEPFLLH